MIFFCINFLFCSLIISVFICHVETDILTYLLTYLLWAAMNELIRLNVGGERYTTTRATLTRYPQSMLGAMFSGAMATSIDEHGCFFIDRDGSMFSHVLNFLRSGRLSLPADFHQLDLLAIEADFYQVEDLIKEISRLQTSAGGSYLEVCTESSMFHI